MEKTVDRVHLRVTGVSLTMCLVMLFIVPLLALGSERPATATVQRITGQVLVAFQGQRAVEAVVGTLMQRGDSIETLLRSRAGLRFSEGSEIEVGESTRITLAQLVQDQQTGARRSRVQLLAGNMRATLTPGHQKEGSAFTIETPNAMADVKFSHPVIDVSYDPVTDTTTIDAYTVDVVITNLRTMRIQQVNQGHRAIIQQSGISIKSGIPQNPADSQSETQQPSVPDEDSETDEEQPEGSQIPPFVPPPQEPEQSVSDDALLQTRTSVREATSTVPSSVGTTGTSDKDTEDGEGEGGGAETSDNPSQGARESAEDERQRRVIIIHFEE